MAILFEVSFEVCNLVGGIHTVLATKAAYIKPLMEEYITIGPYFTEQAKKEFIEEPIPKHLEPVAETLSHQGIFIHYGKWNIPSTPTTILIEFHSLFSELNWFKKDLYDKYQVESHKAGYDVDEPMAFSLAAGKLIEEIINIQPHKMHIVHSHEWMCGYTNLFLKANQINAKTVFTTHATILGRTLSNSNLTTDNPYQSAIDFNILEKHTAEKASATYSDIFTTVSDITAQETEHILNKKPDVITYNGINETVTTLNQSIEKEQQESKQKLLAFTQQFLFPYHTFDITKTTIAFISGRHEIRNKGLDVTIRALKELNTQLAGSDKTVVCFIWVPYHTYAITKELLEQKKVYDNIKDELHKQVEYQMPDLFSELFNQKESCLNIFSSLELRQNIEAFKTTDTVAPICTHEIDFNEIITLINEAGLDNKASNNVKIIYYPKYLEPQDKLLQQTYIKNITGCDIGIFPSLYEPWGYTPAECISQGVPAITTANTGFGQYMKDCQSVLTINRTSDEETIAQIVSALQTFMSKDVYELTELKKNALQDSSKISWSSLIHNYQEAYK